MGFLCLRQGGGVQMSKERDDAFEACAKIADDLERKEYEAVGDPRVPQFKSLIGKAIRARGKK
jgi:hypothetical protein